MMRPSLARQLLRKLLPLMLLIVLGGSGVVYFVAHRVATAAYDKALLDAALAIASQVENQQGSLSLKLPEVAEVVLRTDTDDQIFYAVLDHDNAFLAGIPGLPPPANRIHGELYYDGYFHGNKLRVAAFSGESHGIHFTVLSAETQLKRNRLVYEILLAMLIPEVLLVLLAAWMIRRSVGRELHTIQPLLEEMVKKSHTDLSALPLDNIQSEIYPIFVEVNDLLSRLSSALDAQRHFVADASHQLRTPIAALQAEAEMALRASEPRASLQKIVIATRRITHLSHQLLTLSRLEARPLNSAQPINLAALTQDAAQHWMPHAVRRNIDLGFELSAAPVTGDSVWLEELLGNLLDNALRYTPHNGIVTVRCGTENGQTFWEVEDNGSGIPETEQSHIFERFYRLNTDSEGCGLGLAIAREIASNHQAQIRVQRGNVLGGALFRVTF